MCVRNAPCFARRRPPGRGTAVVRYPSEGGAVTIGTQPTLFVLDNPTGRSRRKSRRVKRNNFLQLTLNLETPDINPQASCHINSDVAKEERVRSRRDKLRRSPEHLMRKPAPTISPRQAIRNMMAPTPRRVFISKSVRRRPPRPKVFEHDVCAYCGEPAMVIDHVFPYKEFREDTPLVPACSECNGLVCAKVFGTFTEKKRLHSI